MEKSRAIELLKLAVPIKALTQQEYADFVEAVNMGMDTLEQPTSPDTIDRQAVIKVLECWQKAFKENSHHASASDLSLVVRDIRALSATRPVATDTNVGDTISRQAAIDALDCISGVEEVLRSLPTVQPERKKGEWIEISSINHTYRCSECGRLLVNVTDGKNNVSKHYPHCHCGADMRGEKDG